MNIGFLEDNSQDGVQKLLIGKQFEETCFQNIRVFEDGSFFHFRQETFEQFTIAREVFPLNIFGVDDNWLNILNPALNELEESYASFRKPIFPIFSDQHLVNIVACWLVLLVWLQALVKVVGPIEKGRESVDLLLQLVIVHIILKAELNTSPLG